MDSSHAKRNGEILRALFRILSASPEGMAAGEALATLRREFDLNEYEQSHYKDGTPKFEKIVRFATLGPKRAGWLVKNKGVWLITQEGLDAFEKLTDPVAFHREVSRLYAQKSPAPSMEAPLQDDEAEEEGTQGLEGEISVSLDKAVGDSRAQIKQYLAAMNPYRFQDLVASLLRAMGYYIDFVARRGPDGGVDIVAFCDDLGIKSPKIKVQVKREMRETTEAGLREFLSFISEKEVGIFVAAGGFNDSARRKARDDRRKLTLIDSERLIDLWIQYYPKLGDRGREYMPLEPVWYLRNTAEDDS